MEIITPFQLYWILRLDCIWGLCLSVAIITGLISAIMTVFHFVLDDDDWRDYNLNKFKKIWKYLRITFVFSVILAIFVPDTREACAIYAVPKVLNNPKVQELCGNSLDVFGIGIKRIKERMLDQETNKNN